MPVGHLRPLASTKRFCPYDTGMQEDNARLTAIEEKLAYLEKYVGDLDEVVRELATGLAKQKDGVTAVRKMLEEHLNDPGDNTKDRDLIDDKPPHW